MLSKRTKIFRLIILLLAGVGGWYYVVVGQVKILLILCSIIAGAVTLYLIFWLFGEIFLSNTDWSDIDDNNLNF